jgi:hypothetical protein
MKKAFILVNIIGLSLLLSCKSGGKGGSGDQPYGDKSGIVTYKPMDMMGVKIIQTMYFDDYGKKERRETIIEGNMGSEMRQHTVDIRDGNIAYHFELENLQGGENRASKEVYKMVITPDLLAQMNIGALSPELKKKFDFKEEGKEKVAGLEGIKYSICPDSMNKQNRITGVHYGNIPLRVSMGQMEVLAEKVELGASIPADKFKIPEGYTIVDESKQGAAEMPADTSAGVK